MKNFEDEARIQHLQHLLADEVLPLRCLAPDLLLDGSCVGVHGQSVLDHLPGDTGHIQWFPREHVGINPEEGDERAFLFFTQLGPDRDHLLGIIPEMNHLSEGCVIGGDPLLSRRV